LVEQTALQVCINLKCDAHTRLLYQFTKMNKTPDVRIVLRSHLNV